MSRELADISTADTEATYFREWIENFSYNHPRIAHLPGVDNLHNIMKGGSALIVNAGPSLNLEGLEQHRHKICLIVVDRALSMIGDHKPDLVVTCEWKSAVASYLKNIQPQTNLVIPVFAHREVMRIAERCTTFIQQPNSEQTEFGKYVYNRGMRKGSFPLGGSVGTLGVGAAIKMGFKRIAITGADLCYDTPGMMLSKREDVDEHWKKVFTCCSFKTSQWWYEEVAKHYKDIEFFRIGFEGLKIRGFDRCGLPYFLSGCSIGEDYKNIIRRSA